MWKLLVVLVLALGCARSTEAPAPAKAAAPATAVAAEPECTLKTPLVPGIPGSPGHLLPSERNPNGDSELAALMRVMQKDLQDARPAVLRGEAPPPLLPRYKKLRCSWPTAAADRNEAFDGLAQGYLARVAAFDAKPKDLAAAFDSVLDGCRACHEASCPGPLVVIDELRVSKPPPRDGG